jgi:hypothetical protein
MIPHRIFSGEYTRCEAEFTISGVLRSGKEFLSKQQKVQLLDFACSATGGWE